MYSWVTQEQWLILSVVGLLVILKIFNYNESIFSEYNKLLTLFIPVFVLMFLGSLMELIENIFLCIAIYVPLIY